MKTYGFDHVSYYFAVDGELHEERARAGGAGAAQGERAAAARHRAPPPRHGRRAVMRRRVSLIIPTDCNRPVEVLRRRVTRHRPEKTLTKIVITSRDSAVQTYS